MRAIEDETRMNGRDCIKFVPRREESNWIRIVKDRGCWSYVGKLVEPGDQQVSIGDGCAQPDIVSHELMHSLGIYILNEQINERNY
jgi:hypothetical protein